MTTGSFQRGSEWRKWDLHIHSPCSLLNNQYPKKSDGSADWEPFLSKLESSDVAVVGITDYFTIEGYKALRQFKEEGRIANIHTILPNIEFRLNTIVSARNGGDLRLNLHVIFSDHVSVDDIQEHFLHDLHFYYQGNPQAGDERMKLKVSNLEVLGNGLIEEHEPFRERGIPPVEVGAMHAVVDHEEITKRLTSDSRFRGKYLTVLAADGWDQINWDGQAHVVRKGLLQKSDMVFSSSPKQQEWCLGRDPYQEGPKKFCSEFKTLKPCVHGCDAHRLEDIGRPCGLRGDAAHDCERNAADCDLRFCWIKADPTFEGLKQLLYEPDDRVAIQTTNPSPVISNLTLREVAIDGAIVNEELSVAGTKIDLNSCLVAVVGGKGAGKTALVDLVAHCYMNRELAEDPNSFVRRISEYSPSLTTSIVFRDGQEFSKRFSGGDFVDEAQVVYVAQGELESYIGEKSDLYQRIRDLIFESDTIKNSMLSFEADEAADLTVTLEKKLTRQSTSITDLEVSTSDEVSDAIGRERKKIDTDLEDIQKRVEELAQLQTEEATKKAEERQERLGSLKTRQENLLSLKEALEEIRDFLEQNLEGFNESVAAAQALMDALEIDEKLPDLTYQAEEKVKEVLELVQKESRGVAKAIDEEQKQQAKMDRDVKAHAKLLEKRGELQASLKAVEEKKKAFREGKKELATALSERKRLMQELLRSVIEQKRKYEEIVRTFSDQKDEILADIDFVAEIRFDAEVLLGKAEAVLDNRRVVIRGNTDTLSEFDCCIRLAREVAKGHDSKVDEFVEELEQLAAGLRSKIKAAPVTVTDFYDVLYRNYMTVVPVVKYKRTTLEKLSLGQKATVLIKIYLAHGDKPIIIDSHDDHLDNEFIMEELVRAIRRAKSNRQVILVSNNGNVVVNSDAEQIIVAYRDDTEIAYVAGAIENPEICERALRVLEGGAEAFRKRQEKYRMIS